MGPPPKAAFEAPGTAAQTQGGWREVRGELSLSQLGETLRHSLPWTTAGHGRGPATAG